jgi:hypothetical protein
VRTDLASVNLGDRHGWGDDGRWKGYISKFRRPSGEDRHSEVGRKRQGATHGSPSSFRYKPRFRMCRLWLVEWSNHLRWNEANLRGAGTSWQTLPGEKLRPGHDGEWQISGLSVHCADLPSKSSGTVDERQNEPLICSKCCAPSSPFRAYIFCFIFLFGGASLAFQR